MVLDSKKALQNGCDMACKVPNIEENVVDNTDVPTDEYQKANGIRPSRQIRARRILSQSDSIRQNSSYGNRPKVQVYSKFSFRYERNRQSSLNRGGSKRRGNRPRPNSSGFQNNRNRRNAVISRLDPVMERKVNLKETRQPSLIPDASTIENPIFRHYVKPVKGKKKRTKGIDVDVFAQLPVFDLSLNAGSAAHEMMLGNKGSGTLGQVLKRSQPIPVPDKKKEDGGSPKLDRLRQQLPLFLSSVSPPTSRKTFGKRAGSPGTPRPASPDTLRWKNAWKIQDPFTWGNLNGQRVEISEADLLSLSEAECVALQKVAEQRLREIDLGVSITVPKDESKLHGKNSTSMLRRAGVHLPLGSAKNKSKKDQDHVFSIPLVRVVENDQLLRLQTACNDESDNDSSGKSSADSSPKTSRRMSSSLDSYADHSSNGSMPHSTCESTDLKGLSPVSTPTDSPSTRRKLPGGRKTLARRGAVLNTDAEIDDVQSKLLESLTETSTKDKKRSLLPPTMPQVPYVVQKCCAHILRHGLEVTGIFRVGGSKKRVKQLRQEFDHGVDVKIDEDYNSHDVAALLKEFFRDLPEALLTRELYPAFISTAKLSGQRRLDALRCLVWLLPMPNRDTLQQLLSFLATVSEYSEDRLDANGKTITGNKMNVANLSVIFGPNILHRHKNNQSSGDAQFQVQSLERAEESTFVIKIVDDMIRSQKDLFMIPRETHDEILRTLQESDPDAVDFLLRRKAANYAKSPSPKLAPEKFDSPLETAKGFPAPSSQTQPLGSDMNNNNKNGNNSSNEQPPKFVKGANSRKSERSRNFYSHIGLQKRSSSEGSFSKTGSPYKNSLSFTEEDMKDILSGDRNGYKKQTYGVTSSSEQSTPEDTTQEIQQSSVKADKESNISPYNNVTLHCKAADQLETVFPRRQGQDLTAEKSTLNHNEVILNTSTVLKKNKNTYRTKSPSPVTLRSASATSGFEDMSSTSSESLSSNRPPTPKHKKHMKIQNATEREIGVCSDSESSTKTKQTEQMSASKASHVPLHSLRLRKNPQVDKSGKDDVVELSDLVPRTFGKERRVSKDDLYLTQDMRRRLQRQQSIII